MAAEPVKRSTILMAIAKGAGNAADGTTKVQVVSWIVANTEHKKNPALRTQVDKLLKAAKKSGVLVRGKNNSRFKLANPTSKENQSLITSKVKSISPAPKAVAANKNNNKNTKISTPISPPKSKPTLKKSPKWYDPFNCHDEAHPDYDPNKCNPKIAGDFSVAICRLLDERKPANDSSDLPANQKRFNEYKFVVDEFKKDPRYKSRYSHQKHNIPPLILQKITSLYRSD